MLANYKVLQGKVIMEVRMHAVVLSVCKCELLLI